MHVIGLVGGIASGKSTVARELEKLGAAVLDADLAAHRALGLPAVKDRLVERWGRGILDESGNVQRAAVAQIVFKNGESDRQELDFLESQLHPVVRADFQQRLQQLESADCPAAVIDAPLLLEAGWGELCDSIVFVEAPADDRKERTKSRNWSAEEIVRRETLQMPIPEKRRLASDTIANNGSLSDLVQETQLFWNQKILDTP